MIKPVAFANAATSVMGGVYAICALLSNIAPDFILSIGQSWVHTINLEAVKAVVPLSVGDMVWGFISLVAVTWVSAYALAVLYNRWAR